MNDRIHSLLGMTLGIAGLTAFWSHDVFAYGYAQMVGGQLCAAIALLGTYGVVRD